MIDNYCVFSKDHKCLKWEDYELTRHELEEADALCHSNWIEIQKLCEYIDHLKVILDDNGEPVEIRPPALLLFGEVPGNIR